MQKRENRTVWCTYTFVSIGMLTALQLILSRFLAINIGGFARVGLGPVATIMAGLWLGPVAGGLTGLIADLLGCLIQGYAVNPLITCAAIAWGVVPAFLCPPSSVQKSKKILRIILAILIASVVSSLVLTTSGLVLIMGYHFYAIMPTRLIQFAFMVPIYCLLVNLLYLSPVTTMVRNALRVRTLRRGTARQN